MISLTRATFSQRLLTSLFVIITYNEFEGPVEIYMQSFSGKKETVSRFLIIRHAQIFNEGCYQGICK